MDNAKEFNKMYEMEVLPILEELEEKRKKEIGKVCLIILITGLVASYFIAYKMQNVHEDYPFLFIFLCLVCIVISIYTYKKYKRELKEKIVPHLLKTFGNIERVETKNKFCLIIRNTSALFTLKKLAESGLFEEFNLILADDEFVGKYKGIPFKMSETSLKMWCGKSLMFDRFKGLILSFKLSKWAEGKTIIRTKGGSSIKNDHAYVAPTVAIIGGSVFGIITVLSFLGCRDVFVFAGLIFLLICEILLIRGGIRSILKTKSDKAKARKTTISDDIEIYSPDGKMNQEFIDSPFVKRFCALELPFKAKGIKLSRYNDKLVIAIDINKNLFEIATDTSKNFFEIGSLFHNLLDPKPIENFCSEINSIYEMLDYLNIEEENSNDGQ